MEFNQNLLFFFSALGAFNGLCMGFFFLFLAKPKHISNKFLGVLLLMMSFRIGKSVIFYFNPDLAFIYLQLGLTACFFIGPFLYFYIKSMVQPKSSIDKNWKYHIAILLPVIVVFGALYPFETHIKLWRFYVIYSIYFQWFLYILGAAWLMRGHLKKLVIAPKTPQAKEVWLLSVFLGNIAIWAAYSFTSITYYLVGALTFSFLFYLLALLVFFNRKKKGTLFVPEHRYADKKFSPEEAALLLDRLHDLMETDAPYTNANLKSSDVAKKMNLTVHQLSQLLNDDLGKSFPNYVNEFRIKKAKAMLVSHQNLTLEAIGYESGFNSKSTFFTTFKKIVGTTPSKFKSQLSGSLL